jgi:hypothetical protein
MNRRLHRAVTLGTTTLVVVNPAANYFDHRGEEALLEIGSAFAEPTAGSGTVASAWARR